jgi:hypothetical protein
VDVAPALTGVEQERKREPLFCVDRPPMLERLNLAVRPRADFFCLRTLDAERRIVLQPSNIDRMADQHAQHFEDRERSAWPIRVRLQDASDDPLPR